MVNQANCVVCKRHKSRFELMSDRVSLSLFKFPESPTRRRKWVEGLNLSESEALAIHTGSRVCQLHFKKSQMVRTRLRKDAVPSLLSNPTAGVNEPGNGNQLKPKVSVVLAEVRMPILLVHQGDGDGQGSRTPVAPSILQKTPKPYMCGICGESFDLIADLESHNKLAHQQHKFPNQVVKMLTCRFCDTLFDNESNLIMHEATHGDGEPRITLTCKVCEEEFISVDTYSAHLKKHGTVDTAPESILPDEPDDEDVTIKVEDNFIKTEVE